MSRNRERWSSAGMPEGAERERILHEIANTMRHIVANPHIPTSASMVPKQADETPPAAGSGSVELRPPPGIDAIDRMVGADSRRKQLAAILEELTNREIEQRLAGDDSDKVQSDWNPFDAEHMKK